MKSEYVRNNFIKTPNLDDIVKLRRSFKDNYYINRIGKTKIYNETYKITNVNKNNTVNL